jgi:hypothetical protein
MSLGVVAAALPQLGRSLLLLVGGEIGSAAKLKVSYDPPTNAAAGKSLPTSDRLAASGILDCMGRLSVCS